IAPGLVERLGAFGLEVRRQGRLVPRPSVIATAIDRALRFRAGVGQPATVWTSTHSANSNSGNGNLRPETLGAPRREKFSQRAKPTAETGSPRAGYGNVALFLALGNHVGLRGL